MSRYAKDTSVSTEKSKGEIERTLTRYGASQFYYGWDQDRAVVGFAAKGRQIRFHLPMPQLDEFAETPTGRERSEASQYKAWEQAQRQRWRALALVIKAKLEAVESGITTFEDEFLAHTVLPNGQRVGDMVEPAIAKMYESGKMLRSPVKALLGDGE